ncbi:MAG: PKD domain-containing protein, partial [Thermoplasmata archaeon]
LTLTAGAPPPRQDGVLAWDPTEAGLVLFGGVAQNDTWLFDGARWSNVTAAVRFPGPLTYPAGAYDPVLGGLVVVGTPLDGPPYSGATFLLAHGRWSELDVGPSRAPELGGASAQFVPSLSTLAVVGSIEFGPDGSISGEAGVTWAVGPTGWTNETAAFGAGPGEVEPALAIDSTGALLAFGGVSATGSYSAGLWTLSAPPMIRSISLSPNPTDRSVPVRAAVNLTGGTDPIRLSVDWGDGSPASPVNASHAYARSGTYGVIITATDGVGRAASLNGSLTIDPDLAVGAIGLAEVPPSASELVFSVTVTGGTAPYRFAWQFGDGTNSSRPAPMHSYARPGGFTVRVLVTDSAGEVGSEIARLTVPASIPGNAGALGSTGAIAFAGVGAVGPILLLAAVRRGGTHRT